MQKTKSIWVLALTAVLSLCLGLVCVNHTQPQIAKAEEKPYLSVDGKLSYNCENADTNRKIINLSSSVALPQGGWDSYTPSVVDLATDKNTTLPTIGFGAGDGETLLLIYFNLETFNTVNPTQITIPAGTKLNADSKYTSQYAGIEFTSALTLTKTDSGWSVSQAAPVQPGYLSLDGHLSFFGAAANQKQYILYIDSDIDLTQAEESWAMYSPDVVECSTDKESSISTIGIGAAGTTKRIAVYFDLETFNTVNPTQITIPAGTKLDAGSGYTGDYAGIEFTSAFTLYKTDSGWSTTQSAPVQREYLSLDGHLSFFGAAANQKQYILYIDSDIDLTQAEGSWAMYSTSVVECSTDKESSISTIGIGAAGTTKRIAVFFDLETFNTVNPTQITIPAGTKINAGSGYTGEYAGIEFTSAITFSKDTEIKDLGEVTFSQIDGNETKIGFLSSCEYDLPINASWEVFDDFNVTAYKEDGSTEQISAYLQSSDTDHKKLLYVWIKGKTPADLADYTRISIAKDTIVTRSLGWKKGVKFNDAEINYYNYEGSWGVVDPSTIVKEVIKLTSIHNEWNNKTGTSYGTYCTLLTFSGNVAVSTGSVVRETVRANILVNGEATTAEQLTYSHAHGTNTLLICINDEDLMTAGMTVELNPGFMFETATLGEGVKLVLAKNEEDKWVFSLGSNADMTPLFTYSAMLGEEQLTVTNNEIEINRTEGDAFDLADLTVGITDKDGKVYNTPSVDGSFDAALSDGKCVYDKTEGATNIYTVTYKFDTDYGLVTVKAKLVIAEKDKVAPVIDWQAGTEVELEEGYDVSQITVTATDDVDGDVDVVTAWSDGAVVDGALVAGVHTLTLTATDAAGNKSEIVVTVTVPSSGGDDSSVEDGSSESGSGAVVPGGTSGGTSGCACASQADGASSTAASLFNISFLMMVAGLLYALVRKEKRTN